MSLKAKVEAIIYAAEEPVTLEQIAQLLKDVVLADLASAKENAAIEQADSAAEALATESEAAESTLLSELVPEPEELICPEPGPLMSQGDAASDDETPEQSEALPDILESEESQPELSSEETQASPVDVSNPDGAPHLPQSADVEGTTDSAASEPAADTNPANPPEEPAPSESATVTAPETTSRKRQPKKTEQEIAEDKAIRARIREVLVQLVTDYASEDRGIEIRQVAGGFRMATKPEHHDVVRAFAKSLKPPIRLSLAALETLAVIAYKQPITGPEIADIRGVESASVLGTLLDRKLITTAGRKQVIGRPMQYKTSKDFLLRFGLNDVNELPSMEEFSQLASSIELAPPAQQETLFEPSAKAAEAQQNEAAPEKELESEKLEAQDEGSQIPESQPSGTAEAADSQPQSEAESSNSPEAEHPIGQ